MADLMSLGAYIRKAREEAGFTQAQLALGVGMSRPSITQLERGQIRFPRMQLLSAISHVLNIPAARLFAEAGLTLPESDSSQLHWLSLQLDKEGTETLIELGLALLRVRLRRKGLVARPAVRR